MHPSAVALARAAVRPVLLAAALVGTAALLILAAPPSDPGRAAAGCFVLLDLPRGRQLVFGCDGFTFLRGAVDPALLLEPTAGPPADFTYQSRPLHIGLAAVLGRVLQPVVASAVPAEARYQGRAPIRRFAGAYVAYVLLNTALLVAAGLALHDALIGLGRPLGARETAALLAGLAFLILSRAVKQWLFTPHTILWGLLIPLWALAVGRRILADPETPPARTLRRAAAAAGLALLAYGYAALVPITGAAALALRPAGTQSGRRRAREWLGAVAPAAALLVLPPLAWVAISFAVSGGFHSHEAVAYRQFRWPLEAIAAGPAEAARMAVWIARGWTASAAQALAAPAGVLAGFLVIAWLGGLSPRALARRHRALFTAATTVVVLGLLFWYLNGSLQRGRAATLGPVVQVVACAIALELDRRADRVRWTGLLAALAVGAGAWTLLGSPVI